MTFTIRRRVVVSTAALLCSALAISGCAGGTSSKGASASGSGSGASAGQAACDASNPQPLRVSTLNPLISTNYLDLLANDLGYFKNNGLDVTFVQVTDATAPLLAGDLDVGNIGPNALSAVAQGQELRFLGSPFRGPQVALMVKEGSPLAAAAHKWPDAVTQLKGKTLGTTTPSGAVQQVATYMVGLAKLTPGSDIKVVPAGNASTLVAGLERGDYDAALVPSPLFETLEAQQKAVSVLDIYKGEGPSTLSIPWLTMPVTATFYDQHKQVVSCYQRAYQQAIDYARNPANTAEMTQKLAAILKVDPSTLTDGIKTFTAGLNKSGEYTKTQWNAAVAMMKANGIVKGDLPYSKYVIPWAPAHK